MPTKEQVLAAAETSVDVKKALEQLFPEYFYEKISFDNLYIKQYPYAFSIRNHEGDLITAYKDCQHYPGFFLNSFYKWEIKDDKYLIPTKKY